MKKFLIVFVLIASSETTFSQNTRLITFKKESSFAFFQMGEKKDTITKTKGNLFFLQAPDSLLRFLIISVENGKFDNLKGDTLLRVNYIKGHKYESFFTKEENAKGENIYKFTTAVNGASALPDKEILITFYDKRKPEKVILENRFVFLQ